MISERGLKNHIKRNEGKPCGILAAKELKNIQLSDHQHRKQLIMKTNFNEFRGMNNMVVRKSRAHGKTFSLEEKKIIS